MSLLMVGLSFQTAPVEVRERLAFTAPGVLPSALAHLKERLAGSECLLLSTCNRTELYVAPGENWDERQLLEIVAELRRVEPETFAPYWYEQRGHRAIEHLFRVTAGLESMILGEPDIVRQVKDAYAAATAAGVTGPILNALVHRALYVAKRARTETLLGHGSFSIGHAAAQMAESIFGSLSGRMVLLLGAGDMSEACARHLAASGASSILVANRTFDRAALLAESLNGRAVRYDEFPSLIGVADIVIASTAAPSSIVHRPMIAAALKARRHRPLFLIDIAVPRDIDADVGDLDSVFLYNIDDLRAVVDSDLARRRQEAARAEELVRDESMAFSSELKVQQTAGPLVSSVRAKMDDICRAELARLRPRLAHLSPEDWRAIEMTMNSMVNKIAHAPTVKIKDYAADPEAAEEKMDTIREIFGLSEEKAAAEGNP